MNVSRQLATATSAIATLLSLPALGQQVGTDAGAPPPVLAPRNAFELTLGGGWQQGFGALHGGSSGDFASLAGPGAGLEVGLAWRITPRISLGVRGDAAQLNQAGETPSTTTLRTAGAGFDGTVHISPLSQLDPWISLGAGYRFFWVAPSGSPTSMTHGLQLARLAFGLDYPVSSNIAVGPFFCADLDLFSRQTAGGQSVEITDQSLATFLSAGFQGRFDLGGTREKEPERTGPVARR